MDKKITSMKKLILLLTMAVVLAGCEVTDPVPESIVCIYTERAQLIFNGNKPVTVGNTSIRVTRINENRCPANANCTWAGYVLVDFEVINAEETFSLFSGPEVNPLSIPQPRSYTLKIDGKSYTLSLSEVLPYPGLPNAPAESVVKVNVN